MRKSLLVIVLFSVAMVPSLRPQVTSASSSPPSLAEARAFMTAYVDAYNRHDVQGVLALMDFHYVGSFGERFRYDDCDFATRTLHILTTKKGLRRWLQRRFELNDHFDVINILQLAHAPKVVGLNAKRTAIDLGMKGWSPYTMGSKFVLDGSGERSMRNVVGDCRPPIPTEAM